MNFLEFHVVNTTEKSRVYINFDKVLFVRPSDFENMTQVYLSAKDYITINEPYSEVVLRILSRRPIEVMPNAERRG